MKLIKMKAWAVIGKGKYNPRYGFYILKNEAKEAIEKSNLGGKMWRVVPCEITYKTLDN